MRYHSIFISGYQYISCIIFENVTQHLIELYQRFFFHVFVFILGDCSQFMSQIETNPDNLSRSSLSWTCHLCSKLYVSKNAMEDHIRGAHLGTQATFECKFCGKHFQSRNSRSGHISKNHKLEMAKPWPQL